MKKILYSLITFAVIACSGGKVNLPDSVYKVKLGETYSESQLVQALNKDTFRSFRVWHNGDTFMPGMHDTFYKTEEDDVFTYSCSKSANSADFSFLDCQWSKFSIATDLSGKIEGIGFSKGSTFSSCPVDIIMKDYNTLLAKLHDLYGDSEDSEIEGKRLSSWESNTTKMTVEYWAFKDYKNDDNAILSCNLQLKAE